MISGLTANACHLMSFQTTTVHLVCHSCYGCSPYLIFHICYDCSPYLIFHSCYCCPPYLIFHSCYGCSPNLIFHRTPSYWPLFSFKRTKEGKIFFRCCKIVHSIADKIIRKRKLDLVRKTKIVSKLIVLIVINGQNMNKYND